MTSTHCSNCDVDQSLIDGLSSLENSRVTELLQNNYLPLDTEMREFRAIANDFSSLTQNLSEKLARCEALTKRLLEAQRLAEAQLKVAKVLIAPTRAIPNEILAEIFLFALPSSDAELRDSPDSCSPKALQWSISQVCRRWRDVAICLPRLWAYIKLDFAEHTLGGRFVTPLECAHKVDLLVERSGRLPLSVYMNEINLPGRALKSGPLSKPLFGILQASMPRWKRLILALSSSTLQSLSGCMFPSLEALSLQDSIRNECNPGAQNPFTAKSAPHLRYLDIYDDPSEINSIILPWAQITEIKRLLIRRPTDAIYLTQIPNVQRITISISGPLPPEVAHTFIPSFSLATRRTRLSHLKSLTLTEITAGSIMALACRLRIPVLEELHLFFAHFVPECRFPSFSDGFPSSLKRVGVACNLDGSKGTTKALMDFYSTLPDSVEELVLESPTLKKQFFVGLNSKKTTLARLPNLKLLDLRRCGDKGDSGASRLPSMYRMLKSRRRGSKSGEPFVVIFPEWLRKSDDEYWANIRSMEGIEVRWW